MGRKGSEDSELTTEDRMPSTSDQLSEERDNTSQLLHVLAVDDSVIDRKVVEKLLKNSCYKVTTVDSGQSALEFLGLGDDHNVVNELQVNMIITDYSMPGMSGYDLLKTVKESSKLKEIPVVVMSSENVSSRKRRGIRGSQACLSGWLGATQYSCMGMGGSEDFSFNTIDVNNASHQSNQHSTSLLKKYGTTTEKFGKSLQKLR